MDSWPTMSKRPDIPLPLNHNAEYVDSLYREFLQDPQSVDASWQDLFQDHLPPSLPNPGQEFQVQKLIETYRERGHLKSRTNPIRPRQDHNPGLALSNFDLTDKDLSQRFQPCQTLGVKTLGEAIQHLESIYCGHLGFEYRHITNLQRRSWLQQEIESTAQTINLPLHKKKRTLQKLSEATVFENFLGAKYIGQKRFSLEGGENTIPAIDAIINEAAEQGVIEVVIGMAHRGRLNILSNIMGKSYEYVFSEFEGMEKTRKVTSRGDGDVKYHLGFKTTRNTPQNKKVILKLMPNPSHLEAVSPVVEGYARGKGDSTFSEGHPGHPEKILPLILHGDAALAGQGVTYEVAQMSKLPGYSTGGTLHFVINNQIGFTTDFKEARTSLYCTDIAKITDSPVIHVNGDDAEAVIYGVELAVKYRQKFGEDVYIDMVSYRKYGHNEGDEPKYTQPDFYKLIQAHDGPLKIYTQKLIKEGTISNKSIQQIEKELKNKLQGCLEKVRSNKSQLEKIESDDEWKSFRKHRPEDFYTSPPTSFRLKRLEKVHLALTTLPHSIKPIKKSLKMIEERKKRFQQNHIDWALAELCAYGSLLLEGHDIRLSGQDCIRGTFSHRHAGIFDEKTAQKYINLNHIQDGQGRMEVHNSPLSEYAVMGFEYGYSLARPEALAIWEAQFGDFSNTAQTIIDQFISSAESKWNINNGLMLYLPHGYEGQGPEHSSAKPERYLHLCAEFNMVVANCTTPANFFHLIRRQVKYPFRIPTIVFTPKSLLRNPQCISQKEDLTLGGFQEYIDDSFCDKSKVKKVLLCTGKIFYDLRERQTRDNRKDVAIIRLEQLHPLPFQRIEGMLAKYQGASIFWVQEEPKNMGYWNYITRKFDYLSSQVISRKSSASPATGYLSLHLEEQQAIIKEAFS